MIEISSKTGDIEPDVHELAVIVSMKELMLRTRIICLGGDVEEGELCATAAHHFALGEVGQHVHRWLPLCDEHFKDLEAREEAREGASE